MFAIAKNNVSMRGTITFNIFAQFTPHSCRHIVPGVIRLVLSYVKGHFVNFILPVCFVLPYDGLIAQTKEEINCEVINNPLPRVILSRCLI